MRASRLRKRQVRQAAIRDVGGESESDSSEPDPESSSGEESS
jgi:hypothetical protein